MTVVGCRASSASLVEKIAEFEESEIILSDAMCEQCRTGGWGVENGILKA